MFNRTCPNCTNTFQTENKGIFYCCDRCRKEALAKVKETKTQRILKTEQQVRSKKSEERLTDLTVRASELGMSYGKFMSLLSIMPEYKENLA